MKRYRVRLTDRRGHEIRRVWLSRLWSFLFTDGIHYDRKPKTRTYQERWVDVAPGRVLLPKKAADKGTLGEPCTECGKRGATERHVDAADALHWFHPRCWRQFQAWLSGKPIRRQIRSIAV